MIHRMEIFVADSRLDFLTDASNVVTSSLPIRVMQASYRKYDLLRALPLFTDVPRWKCLDYDVVDDSQGSIRVIDDWRMGLRSENANQERKQVTITKIWRKKT